MIKSLKIRFSNNYANFSGHNLFGGLLDRCTVVSDANLSQLVANGAALLENISNINSFETSSVSSKPVQVCFCKNNEHDCSQLKHSVHVKRGNTFVISVVAVDQINQPISATIQSSFNDISLPESQRVQKVGSNCSDLNYQVTFPGIAENHELAVYADGPCHDRGISKLRVSVYVKCSCPPGFMPADTSTECVCICDQRDKMFSKYIKRCNSTTESVIREGVFWISYLHNSSFYLIFPYCPLDYCQLPSKSIPVNLNQLNGADAQCADNRHGILCGKCQLHYSLSLGSSKCIECPNNWRGQLVGTVIAVFFAGIVLVVVLLVLNLTVAVGTLNSIIFYANIIYANYSLYFGQSHLTLVKLFTSWLNLDAGIDICFFEGMDTFTKTWLQLAFPVYIILLVVAIIWISSYSSKFSRMIGKRNPVATLATLILLSYTKLLQTIITSLSFVSAEYPNDTTVTKWPRDASVEFGKGKHITLIVASIFILFFSLPYTVLIFSWQWLLHCPRSKFFKWIRNHKLHSFINTYHVPHTAKHRYWTGLQLLIRVIVYLIAAFSASNDQPITLLSTVVIMSCLLLYKTTVIIRVYKNWLLNAIESFVYFNIAIFAVFTTFTYNNPSNRNREILQKVVANVSVGAIFVLFVCIIIFHMYRYCNDRVYSLCPSTKFSKRMKEQTSYSQNRDSRMPPDNKLLDIIDSPRVSGGYTPPPLQLPSSSIISLTNFDKTMTSDSVSSLDQSVEENLLTQQQQNVQENIRRVNISRPLDKEQVPDHGPSMITDSIDEDTKKPLLKEDSV